MTNVVTKSAVDGRLKGARGAQPDILADIQQLYTDELDVFQRPDILKRIAVSTGAVVAVAAYLGSKGKDLAIKGLYAFFASGIGINIGMSAGDSRVDSAAAAAAYLAFVKASGALHLTRYGSTSGWYEALGSFAAGLGYDYYVTSQAESKEK